MEAGIRTFENNPCNYAGNMVKYECCENQMVLCYKMYYEHPLVKEQKNERNH